MTQTIPLLLVEEASILNEVNAKATSSGTRKCVSNTEIEKIAQEAVALLLNGRWESRPGAVCSPCCCYKVHWNHKEGGRDGELGLGSDGGSC